MRHHMAELQLTKVCVPTSHVLVTLLWPSARDSRGLSLTPWREVPCPRCRGRMGPRALSGAHRGGELTERPFLHAPHPRTVREDSFCSDPQRLPQLQKKKKKNSASRHGRGTTF